MGKGGVYSTVMPIRLFPFLWLNFRISRDRLKESFKKKIGTGFLSMNAVAYDYLVLQAIPDDLSNTEHLID
jgi:hypothetical protein